MRMQPYNLTTGIQSYAKFFNSYLISSAVTVAFSHTYTAICHDNDSLEDFPSDEMHPWSFRASFDTGAADRNDIQIETESRHAIPT